MGTGPTDEGPHALHPPTRVLEAGILKLGRGSAEVTLALVSLYIYIYIYIYIFFFFSEC